jgi:hypothetical protein
MFTPRSSALTLATSLLAGLLASSASAADLDLPPPPPPPVVQQAPAPAPQPVLRGDFQATGGAYAVDNGYSDRAFMGLQGSLYDDSGFGVHMDAVHVQREEEAAFVAAGLSYAVTPGTRLKLMAGTSTDNLEIQPELYLNGSATFDLGPQAGLVITPEVIYREYRSGTEEVQAQGSISKYFKPFKDGSYIVGTVFGSATFVQPGDNVGWEAGANVLHVRPRYMSMGMGVVAGTSAYDNLLGPVPTDVRNDYIGVRPSVSMYLSPDVEVFARGEYLWTDFYELAGGFAGIKYAF